MTSYGGVSDKIQVLEETAYGDGGAGGEIVFGITRRFEWRVETSTNKTWGLETSGPGATVITDGILVVSGSHEWELTNGSEFKAIFGTKTGTGTYTLSTANTLPSYAVKAVDGDDFILISGIKYSKFTVTVSRDETILVSADWFGQRVQDTSDFTPTVTSVLPLTYADGCLKFGGTAQTEVDSIVVEINRSVVPRKFIECSADSEGRRIISSLIEGPLDVNFNGVMGAKRSLIEETWGSTTYTDTRANKVISLTMSRDGVSLNLGMTGVITSIGRTLEKSAEVAMTDFAGTSLNIAGTGTYSP